MATLLFSLILSRADDLMDSFLFSTIRNKMSEFLCLIYNRSCKPGYTQVDVIEKRVIHWHLSIKMHAWKGGDYVNIQSHYLQPVTMHFFIMWENTQHQEWKRKCMSGFSCGRLMTLYHKICLLWSFTTRQPVSSTCWPGASAISTCVSVLKAPWLMVNSWILASPLGA